MMTSTALAMTRAREGPEKSDECADQRGDQRDCDGRREDIGDRPGDPARGKRRDQSTFATGLSTDDAPE
jgi:hypothetical protein